MRRLLILVCLLVPALAFADDKSDALAEVGRAYAAVEEALTLETRWNRAVECNGAVAMAIHAEVNGADEVLVIHEGQAARRIGFDRVIDVCQRAERDAATRLAHR